MHNRTMTAFLVGFCALAPALALTGATPTGHTVRFVFTSDAHYGVARAAFRGAANVPAHLVNMALVAKINQLPAARFPADAGVDAGEPVGTIDFIVEGGDTTNREEGTGPTAIQPAAVSWAQFVADYDGGLTITNAAGRRAGLYIVPGNHEASNAVGFYLPMTPRVDATPMVEIFNRMLQPPVPKTIATFDFQRDRVLHSTDLAGVHFVFLQIWPDSTGRAWMDQDLAKVPPRTPVVIFVHDQPEAQAKHFRNPNGPHNVNAADKFENLLSDTLADGRTIESPTIIEQRALERFLGKHPNIAAYFHGNSNWNEFYDWRGPDRTVTLHTFRVDSPMKGRDSGDDERRLSFHVATIDTAAMRMTVRECYWNQGPGLAWGATSTVDLAVAQSRKPTQPAEFLSY